MDRAGEKVTTPFMPLETRRGWAWGLQGASLVVLVAFLYAGILQRLVQQWWDDPNFSHGFFIPAFSAFVIWQTRKKLAAIPVAPAWWGLGMIAGSLLIMIVGVLGAELFLSRSSLVFLLAGLAIYFLGWRYFRAMLFPWAILFLMIPIPAIVFNRIAFPLQLLASQFASSLLDTVGVPVLREGNVIQLPAITLEVAEACSGIRSLITLGALAIIYGYFLERIVSRRVILAIAALPIAVVANGLRVMGTGLVGHYWDPAKAHGFFHSFSGWVIFVVSLGLLFSLHAAMNLLGRRGTRPAGSSP